MADPGRRTAAARLLGAGAKGAERVAAATGVDKALEDALEEAIVRALRSPAVERALVRVIERNAVQDAITNAVTSEEVAEAIIAAINTEAADRVWAEILASDKAQMLVERIAEAPEVRAAITEQGVGLLTDIGRRLTVLTEALDDAAEKVVHKVFRTAGHEQETDEVGLITRTVAGAIDVGLLSALFSASSGLLASVVSFFAGQSSLPAWGVVLLLTLAVVTGGAILATFWALVGQTPGMRLLSIRLMASGTHEIGLRRAVRRLLGVPLALLPAGIGFLAILVSPTRRGWHDRLAGTKVVYDRSRAVAPHATRTTPTTAVSGGPRP